MNMQPKTVLTDLSLGNGWMLIRAGEARPLSVGLLIDIHSVLLTQGVIVEPYWLDLDRIYECEWLAERSFDLDELGDDRHILTLNGVDCHAIVSLNGTEIGHLAPLATQRYMAGSKLVQFGIWRRMEGGSRHGAPLLCAR